MYCSNLYMNQAKRQLSVDMPWEAETKKLRTFDENNITINCIEDLSNELFYEIFDHLDACDVFHTFSNLNTRFRNLLNGTTSPLKVHCSTSSEQFFEYHCKRTIIPNKYRIISLHLLNRLQIYTFFTLHTIGSSFYRLESLVLHGIRHNESISVLSTLTILPRLFSLNIRIDDTLSDFNEVYCSIFRLPVLKFNKLSVTSIARASQDLTPVIDIGQLSPIEQLVIDHPCSLQGLIVILSHTPRLSRLSCECLFTLDPMIQIEVPIKMYNLTHLSIKPSCLQFDQFEMLMRKLFSQIRVLRCVSSSNIAYLDPDRWEQLISWYMPHLHTFIFEYHDSSSNYFERPPYRSFINKFTSSFWTGRQWLFDIKIGVSSCLVETIIYSIRPYKKQWYELFDDNNRFNPVTSSALSQLTVRDGSVPQYDLWFIDYIRFIPSVAQITSLRIAFLHFSIDTLIQILHLLPNLDFLTVIELFPDEVQVLTKDKANCNLSISNNSNNKITKVNIETMIELNAIDILINICPRMEYLRVKCTTDIDLQSIFYLILTKRNMNFIPHLDSLCLSISEANDEMVKRLQTKINSERLLVHYTIKRIYDRIYLQWKNQ